MSFDINGYIGIGLGMGYKDNNNPKENKRSAENIFILLPFILIMFEWHRTYNLKIK